MRLHVKGRFPVKSLAFVLFVSKNIISESDISAVYLIVS